MCRPSIGSDRKEGAHIVAPLRATVRVSLPRIIQWFKTMTTNEYIRGVKQLGWTAFRDQLWQRNYHEHIIRTQESVDRIRRYILKNPATWEFDHENPAATIAEAKNPWLSSDKK